MALQQNNNNNNNNNEKVTENSGNFVPPLLRKGDQSLTLHRLRVSTDARANCFMLIKHPPGNESLVCVAMKLYDMHGLSADWREITNMGM